MLFNLLISIFAALALAAATGKPCVSDTKYTLRISTGTETLPLHAIDNGPEGTVLLVADPGLNLPGTTISQSGTSGNTDVMLEVSPYEPLTNQSSVFYLSVPDMGELHGKASPAIGSKDFPWPHWYSTFQNIWPKQTSGAQVYFACNTTLFGQNFFALSWGLMGSDGSAPEGCYGTAVAKAFDVSVPC